MKSCFLHSFVICLFLCVSQQAVAQFVKPQDEVSVEALIYNHKRINSKLITRAGLEEVNAALHNLSAKAAEHYLNVNDSLDNYQYCFSLIDKIYTAGATALNIYRSYDDVKEKIKALGELNKTYYDKCLSKGRIEPSDTLITDTYRYMVKTITKEADDLIHSLNALALFVSGVQPCPTPDFFMIMEGINGSLDRIRWTIDHGYYVLWKYITIRTTYWQREYFRSRSINDICSEAYRRWHVSRMETLQGVVRKVKSKN